MSRHTMADVHMSGGHDHYARPTCPMCANRFTGEKCSEEMASGLPCNRPLFRCEHGVTRCTFGHTFYGGDHDVPTDAQVAESVGIVPPTRGDYLTSGPGWERYLFPDGSTATHRMDVDTFTADDATGPDR